MRVLIVGCGYVGTALGRLLADRGERVFGLRRDVRRLPSEITGVAADLGDPSSLRALPEVEAVVFATAPPTPDEDGYRLAYLDGPRRVLDALPGSPRRLLLTSSTSVHGRSDGGWVDEATEPAPATEKARTILAGEAALSASAAETVVVRFGGIYGPGRDRLLRGVESGALGISPEPSPFTNRIHREDCAGILAHLLALEAPAPLYLGVDSDPASWNEVVRWLASELGVDCAHRDSPREGLGKRCRNDALLASRYEFRHPSFRDGYRELLGLPGN